MAVKAPICAVLKVLKVAPPTAVQVELLADDCHCMVPVFPAKVIPAGEFPVQIVCELLAVPATETGVIEIVIVLDGADEQTPLVTLAL